jgi:hypothetical protein
MLTRMPRPLSSALIALLMACLVGATTATVLAWLAGAHVTPEQALRHAQAVAQYGQHEHGGRAHRHEAPPADQSVTGGLVTLTTLPSAAVAGSWLAIAATLLMMLTTGQRHPLGWAECLPPSTRCPEILPPPPR